jgi:WD40 repeat protein
VSCGSKVLILHPVIRYDKPVVWDVACTLKGKSMSCLCWSGPNELYTGSTTLDLWEIPDEDEPRQIWSRDLANGLVQVAISPDSCLIATVATNDRLVKVWRRLSFDLDNPDFDFIYLPHPKLMKSIRWRQSFDQMQ